MSETLRQMIQRIPSDAVMDSLVRLGLAENDELPSYRRVMALLEEIESDSASNLTSIIVSVFKDEDGRPYGDVSGIEAGYDRKVGIEFSPWAEWLQATIIRGERADALTDDELVAHCLWEMTWISDDPEEIAKRHRELVAIVEEFKDKIEEKA